MSPNRFTRDAAERPDSFMNVTGIASTHLRSERRVSATNASFLPALNVALTRLPTNRTASSPTLWRVLAYRSPGFPRPRTIHSGGVSPDRRPENRPTMSISQRLIRWIRQSRHQQAHQMPRRSPLRPRPLLLRLRARQRQRGASRRLRRFDLRG